MYAEMSVISEKTFNTILKVFRTIGVKRAEIVINDGKIIGKSNLIGRFFIDIFSQTDGSYRFVINNKEKKCMTERDLVNHAYSIKNNYYKKGAF